MASINLYLKKPNDVKETLIILSLSANRKRYILSTGEKILPKYWNSAKQEAKKFTGSPELNARLETIKSSLLSEYHRILTAQPTLPFQEIYDKFKAFMRGDKPKQKTFSEVYEEFLTIRQSELKESTLKKYRTLISKLNDFTEKKKIKLSFENINLDFESSFRNYFLKKARINDTISKYFACLKAFMQWAYVRGYHATQDYKNFTIVNGKKDIVYLTKEELMKLYNFDLASNLRLQRVRDVFCFACFTGQRFSDIANLKWTDIVGTDWHLYQIKGNKQRKIIVPLNDFAREILLKYENTKTEARIKVLPVITNQKTNDYLKELGKLVHLNELHTIVKYSGKNRIEKVEPKYNLISTHTARRTFVTLSLEGGMRPETVMEITGHEDYKVMKKYLKITDKVKEIEMNNVWKKQPTN